MKITTQRNEYYDNMFAFSVSFSKSYGLIGIDFAKRSTNIVLWAKPKIFTMTEKR